MATVTKHKIKLFNLNKFLSNSSENNNRFSLVKSSNNGPPHITETNTISKTTVVPHLDNDNNQETQLVNETNGSCNVQHASPNSFSSSSSSSENEKFGAFVENSSIIAIPSTRRIYQGILDQLSDDNHL